MVLLAVPPGAGLPALHLHLRVLPAVRAEQEVPGAALGQVRTAAPTRYGFSGQVKYVYQI